MTMKHKFIASVFFIIFLPISASAQSIGKGLDTLIQCKPGTTFTNNSVESQFLELGLEKGTDGFYFPTKGKSVAFLDDEIIAAGVFSADGEKKIAIYLRNQTGKQLAKKFHVTTIDEFADTDEPSYLKQTGTKTTLLIGSAAELDTGSKSIPFHSSITCQITN